MEIPDVVNEKKIFFFREPRLGSYLCYNISYRSSLNYDSLLSAIKNLQEYLEKNDEYEKAKAEQEEQEKQNAENEEKNENEGAEDEEEEKKDENENGEEGEDEQKEKLVKPVLADFEKKNKKRNVWKKITKKYISTNTARHANMLKSRRMRITVMSALIIRLICVRINQ